MGEHKFRGCFEICTLQVPANRSLAWLQKHQLVFASMEVIWFSRPEWPAGNGQADDFWFPLQQKKVCFHEITGMGLVLSQSTHNSAQVTWHTKASAVVLKLESQTSLFSISPRLFLSVSNQWHSNKAGSLYLVTVCTTILSLLIPTSFTTNSPPIFTQSACPAFSIKVAPTHPPFPTHFFSHLIILAPFLLVPFSVHLHFWLWLPLLFDVFFRSDQRRFG